MDSGADGSPIGKIFGSHNDPYARLSQSGIRLTQEV